MITFGLLLFTRKTYALEQMICLSGKKGIVNGEEKWVAAQNPTYKWIEQGCDGISLEELTKEGWHIIDVFVIEINEISDKIKNNIWAVFQKLN